VQEAPWSEARKVEGKTRKRKEEERGKECKK